MYPFYNKSVIKWVNRFAELCKWFQQIDRTQEREFHKNIYFCFIDYSKVFDCVDHNKLWKILKEMGISDHFTCLLRNLYLVKKQQAESYMEQLTGSKLRKDSDEAVYCYSVYLTYIQSTSCEMPG